MQKTIYRGEDIGIFYRDNFIEFVGRRFRGWQLAGYQEPIGEFHELWHIPNGVVIEYNNSITNRARVKLSGLKEQLSEVEKTILEEHKRRPQLEGLALPKGIESKLVRLGILTVKDLAGRLEDDLYCYKGIGKYTLEKIKEALKFRNLRPK